MSNYPGSLDTFSNKSDKQDDYEAAHMNAVQDAIEAIQTELGTDPAGSQTDVKSRLANIIDGDGGINGGASFPGTTYPKQLFYRTDQDILYVRDNADSSWTAIGASVTNLVSEWHGQVDRTTDGGMQFGTSLIPTISGEYVFLSMKGNAYATVRTIYYKKVAGADTLKFYAQRWGNTGTSYFRINVDPGGSALTGELTTTATTPTWGNNTVDVSSLTNGNYYTIAIQMRGNGTSDWGYCAAYQIFAEA